MTLEEKHKGAGLARPSTGQSAPFSRSKGKITTTTLTKSNDRERKQYGLNRELVLMKRVSKLKGTDSNQNVLV